MIYIKNTEEPKMNLLKKLKNLGALAIVLTLPVLTCCGSASVSKMSNLNIYQPSTLRLKKNNSVSTKDGIYTPQKDEVWHSDARYRELEREVFYLPRHQILSDK